MSFPVIRSATGNEGALKAMKSNEKMTNRRYREAAVLDLPPTIGDVVVQNYDDERRHLEYVVKALAEKMWKAKAGVP